MLKTDEIVESFIQESQKYIKEILKCAKQLKMEGTKNHLSHLLYELDNFKTTASLLGYKILYSLIKGLESLIFALYNTRIELNSKTLQLLFYTCDMFVFIVKNIDEEKTDDIPIDVFLDTIHKAVNGLSFSFDKIIEVLQPKVLKKVKQHLNFDDKKNIEDIEKIEIGIDRVNTIIQEVEKLVLKQYQLKKYIVDIQNEIEKTNSSFLKLLKKQLVEDLENLDEIVVTVQKNIFKLRLIPLQTILNLIRIKVKEEAKKQKKVIDFHFSEVDLYLDKDLLELLSEILYQLLKNTIDHAYEPKEARVKKGKNEIVQVYLEVYVHAEHVTIEVSDDGLGIDFDIIRFRALDLFPEKTDSILEMSERELSSFLYLSAFSSVEEYNSFTPRGYGLDIARKNVDKCKGKISFTTEKDIGTEFSLSIPTSIENLKGVFVKAGTFTFLIPVHFISEIYNCDTSDLFELQNNMMFRLRDEVLPVYSLNALINETIETKNKDTQVILVIEYLEKKIGISINELLHTVSVIVKPLPEVLKNFTAFQGLVLDDSHSFVPVLDIPELIERLELLQTYALIKAEAKISQQTKRILVIDHSVITREIYKSILEVEGFQVDAVEDGIQALQAVKNRKYDTIVSDLKLPKMSGNVFIENLKRVDGYRETPILIISSLEDKGIIDKTRQLGVQNFIYKSVFNREVMVKMVKGLAYGTK